MKEYRTRCPDCLKEIIIKMHKRDKRRNDGDFFTIKCLHCKRQWYAKIFEKLVTYPHKLFLKK